MMLIRSSRRWSGRSDGAIQSKRRPQDPVQSLRGRDFRFRPDTGVFETVAGRSQFGLAGDDWGNRFLSWNTIPIRHEVIPDAFLFRSPVLAAVDPLADLLSFLRAPSADLLPK